LKPVKFLQNVGRYAPALALCLVTLAMAPAIAQQSTSTQQPASSAAAKGRPPLLNAEEQAVHEKKMASFKTYAECNVYLTEQRKLMDARAREQGRNLQNVRRDECDELRKQGVLK
jgi:hypothetical protein